MINLKFFDKLERKLSKFYIHNLMLYIILITAFIYVFIVFTGNGNLGNLVLYPQQVLNGEVWRLLTFIFIPPLTSPFWIIFTLYFYYLAGTGLEDEWGGFKFNMYYLVGIIATIIVSFITGLPATGAAINLSLFLAFARVYPDFEMLVFFVLPIKVKYLGYLNWIIILMNVIQAGNINGILLALVPAMNFLIFFGKDIITGSNRRASSIVRKQKFNASMNSASKEYFHKCRVCGVTDVENPDIQFRYCSKCSGRQCYCENHIKDHKHI